MGVRSDPQRLMTLTRAALYIGVASVLGGWLSSVASSMPQGHQDAPAIEHAPAPVGFEADVEEQSRLLRQRLASGRPAPRPVRNPFEFWTPPSPARPATAGYAAGLPFDPPPPAPSAEAELSLIGVAAHQRPAGLVHTAMIATVDGDLIMAVAGETVLGRYTVAAVGADSVDLVDPATGTVVRLRLDTQ